MFLFGNAGGTKFASCFICNERGHLSKNCPKNSHGIYPKVYLLLVFDVELFCNSESCIVGITRRTYMLSDSCFLSLAGAY